MNVRGETIVAELADDLLRLWRPDGTPFNSPEACELRLPSAKIVHVHPWGGTLRFFGAFDEASRSPIVALDPIAAPEALVVANQLQCALGLPLRPLVCSADDLGEQLPPTCFVIATGEYRTTPSGPDFGRVRLSGALWHATLHRRAPPAGRYRVAGFFERRGSAFLEVIEMTPE